MSARLETVLITGASSGIGLELARCFAREQAGNVASRLILLARNTAAMETLAADLRRECRAEIQIMTADLAQPETPRRVFQELSRRNIAVDVLVNNAGFGANGAFAGMSLARQMDILRVNVNALVELTGLFLPSMIQRRTGGVLNVGSVAGFLPGPYMAVYYASKSFVQSFTEALAVELVGSGVTVSVLCPGPTETNFGNVARAGKARLFKPARFKMSATEVARTGHEAFRRGRVIAVPGWTNKMAVFSMRIGPRAVIRKVSAQYNRTED